MAPIRRVTMFTTNSDAGVEFLTEKYSTMKADATKDNKPYILSITAGKTVDDPRGKGITFAAIMTFSSLEDMKYYDEECTTHAALKAGLKGKVTGPPLVVFFEEGA